ncbi:MAG TPA: formylmethanofuran dehydrogenase subunit A [Methanosarcinales archaeon]|nr:formylmethanofuran dehydrogenase subunit A [Methanosarcinales archaeon]
MAEMIIKNGVVYDPANGVNGEKNEICIKDGKIVESVGAGARIIDAEGCVVMPGGVDGHTHCAGKINVGRVMSPHDMRYRPIPGLSGQEARTKLLRPQVGYNTPNTHAIGYRYSKLGYTTIAEAAIVPMMARHMHEEFEAIPILDKLGLVLMGSNWQVMQYIADGDSEKLKAYVAWLLLAARGYGVKVVNPGGGSNWTWGKNVTSIDDKVIDFDVTPAQILLGLAEANESLKLPHSIHVHCNNLGVPGNLPTTLATMKLLEKVKASRDRQVMHLTHLQFHSYTGTSWMDFTSGAADIADYMNKHDHLTFDMGQVIFGPAMTMTADGPTEYRNARMFDAKWSNYDEELEDASGVVPLSYTPYSFAHAVMWAIGLELALLVKDPWKVMFTTDNPNGGSFVNYPEGQALLMSDKKRQEVIKGFPDMAMDRMSLQNIDRELDWNEIATMTRAMPAKMLGLTEKGHLGAGADGDVAIYDIAPEKVDPSVEHEAVKKALSFAKYTIKGGEVVVADGEVTATPKGKVYWVNAYEGVLQAEKDRLMADIKERFAKYYSIQLANYMVEDAYLPRPVEIRPEAI